MAQQPKSTAENRLRTIYECIDNGQEAKALRECDSLLKKAPDAYAAKVLKALCLFRGDKHNEGWEILEELEKPGRVYDDSTLSAFVHTYKEAEMPQRMVNLMVEQCRLNPSEQNYIHLFMAAVRVRGWSMQATTVLSLSRRQEKSHPYLLWKASTHLTQGIEETNERMKTMHLSLAEKVMESHYAQGVLCKNSPEVEFKALVYDTCGKFVEAAEVYEDKHNKDLLVIPPHFIIQRILALLFKAKVYKRIITTCEKALSEDCDHWDVWMAYFDAHYALMADAVEDETESMIKKMMEYVLSYCKDKEKKRGPFLARFELTWRLRNMGRTKEPEIFGDALTQFTYYIKKFYKTPCCYKDLAKYLPMITVENQQPFYDFLGNLPKTVTGDIADDYCRSIIIFETIRRRMGVVQGYDKEAKRQITTALMTFVSQLLELQKTNSDVTAGEMALLGNSILWDDWKDRDDWTAMMTAISFLKHTAFHYPTEFFSRLSLCRIYGHLAIPTPIVEIFRELDIKSVQLETLGYLHYPAYELSGRFYEATARLKDLLSMYTQADKEIAECMIVAYRNGTYSQLPGVMELRQKMLKSSMYCYADSTHRLLKGIFSTHLDQRQIVETMESNSPVIDWDAIADNRDLSIIANWEPDTVRAEIDKANELSHHEFIDAAKLRHLLCQVIAHIGKPTGDSAKAREGVVAVKTQIDHCKGQYPQGTPCRLLHSATPVRLAQWVGGSFLPPVVALLNAAVEIIEAKEKNTEVHELSADLLPSGEKMTDELTSMFPSTPNMTGHFFLHEPIVTFSRALQTMAMCRVILSFIERRIDAPEKPKNKKAKGYKPMPIVDRMKELDTTFKEVAKSMENVLFGLRKTLTAPEHGGLIPNLDEEWPEDIMPIISADHGLTSNTVVSSYTSSLDDLTDILVRIFKVPKRK